VIIFSSINPYTVWFVYCIVDNLGDLLTVILVPVE